MKKISDKKEEAGKRTFPPSPPYRERPKKKEQFGFSSWSQYRACVREYLRARGWTKRRLYDEAGAAADEIMATCACSILDHHVWAARMYQYPWAITDFLETAHEKFSARRAGELNNHITAFQSWINRNYPDINKLALANF